MSLKIFRNRLKESLFLLSPLGYGVESYDQILFNFTGKHKIEKCWRKQKQGRFWFPTIMSRWESVLRRTREQWQWSSGQNDHCHFPVTSGTYGLVRKTDVQNNQRKLHIEIMPLRKREMVHNRNVNSSGKEGNLSRGSSGCCSQRKYALVGGISIGKEQSMHHFRNLAKVSGWMGLRAGKERGQGRDRE